MRSRLARRGLARTLVWSWFDWRGGVLGMMVLVCVVIGHFGGSIQDTPLSYNRRAKISIGLWAESRLTSSCRPCPSHVCPHHRHVSVSGVQVGEPQPNNSVTASRG